MLRTALGGVLIVLVAASSSPGSDPQLTQLKTQLKLLKEQEKGLVATVKARYKALINQAFKSEKDLARERTISRAEEKQLAALAATKADKEKIHKSYEELFAHLR